ncbi:hypothetical protein PC129_g6917 [Phytophthora cactorum]|uniref:Uncharacterized protein n=1 Tax=Phytophthora cactorum TaxID=29920 RepID=A0A329RKY3_9STRA|nr:hypothetical protein Pcac1_g5893 [Phytophthora cactorum]KAG2887295.1 hypothetical protein PC114_g18874 [Phytophthora cactorum]KAG2914288.1 hypothetical protein PC117_g18366 [Phytophthora cactorum]KAG3006170.1 hypothetical protein PC120_g17533 [Phytophthora cactorum]KAG3023893.1 hypothetical protein PC119_g8736 [Phytophthora cactorum]
MARRTDTNAERKYKDVRSYWDLQDPEHGRGLCNLLHKWVVEDNLAQGELENRPHFCHMEGVEEENTSGQSDESKINSYLGAVTNGIPQRTEKQETSEQRRMRECVRDRQNEWWGCDSGPRRKSKRCS